ncbi:MAG: hypothetical protein E6300_13490 [Clostridium sp.]|uniref:hypothetical protein n=1 Tax=Clostridium sp. TaxID=1506 RepID=UPI001EBD3A2C|nr:hypothetical protein [Clostridium sp.]MBS5886099.1 hypothetical protein [Clostridium sp.]MDU7149488.1 hypothetical protein [Clostridium sp.]MDU7242592.1 hypothetical protein [Clostridium sp.]
MKKFKIIRAIILGIVITVVSSNVAFAETAEDNKSGDQIMQIAVVDESLVKKQEEIDEIIFNNNSKEIIDKGFNVISTSIVGSFVEVRIEPYNEENAEHLYNILGRDMINVVEGEQAIPIANEDSSTDAEFKITSSEDNVQDAELYTSNDIKVNEDKYSGFIVLGLVLAVGALGGVAILSRKRKVSFRR